MTWQASPESFNVRFGSDILTDNRSSRSAIFVEGRSCGRTPAGALPSATVVMTLNVILSEHARRYM
jgi:hypothetical protein